MAAITAAAITAGGGLVGDALNHWSSASNATTAYNRTMALDQYLGTNQASWQVQGYEKAGINPILAAGGGFGTGATQVAPQAQLAMSQIPQALSSAANIYQQGQKVPSEVQLNTATAGAQGASAKKQTMDTLDPGQASAASQAQTRNLNSSAKQADASTQQLTKSLDEIEAKVELLKSQKDQTETATDWMPILNTATTQLQRATEEATRAGIPLKTAESHAASEVNKGLTTVDDAAKGTGQWIAQKLQDLQYSLQQFQDYARQKNTQLRHSGQNHTP